MAEHTKGEWITEASMSSSRFTRDILPAGECSVIAQVGGQGLERDIANARLIAAAPDLLAAGEKAVSLLESLATALLSEGLTHIFDNLASKHGGDKHGKGSTLETLREAIAKAEKD